MHKLLDEQPARTDLTSREVAKILGGLVGCLIQMTENADVVRDAFKWWAETDAAWDWAYALKALDPKHASEKGGRA